VASTDLRWHSAALLRHSSALLDFISNVGTLFEKFEKSITVGNVHRKQVFKDRKEILRWRRIVAPSFQFGHQFVLPYNVPLSLGNVLLRYP
jgi:hypothetical protein